MKIKDIVGKIDSIDPFVDIDKYFKSAVLIPLVELNGEPHIIFEKRASAIRQGGEVCLPGGGIDEGETSRETVTRELHEELGVVESDLTLYREFEKVINPMAGVYVETWIGEISIEGYRSIKLNRDEVERIFVVPLSYFKENDPEVYHVTTVSSPYSEDDENRLTFPAKELNLPGRYHKRWARKVHPVYLWQCEEVIWGLTAKIVKKFVDYLR